MLTKFIWTLPQDVQCEIRHALILAGIEGEDVERAMDSRLCDLEDAINVTKFL